MALAINNTTTNYSFTNLPSRQNLRVNEIETAFFDLNTQTKEELVNSIFFKNAKSFNLEDLKNKDNLYQYILLMNTIHNQEFDSSIKYGKSSLLDFEECTCGHAPRYENTRDVKNVRWEIDAKVSRLTASKFTDRSEKLTYFSAGPGDFLQDWMILSRLMLLGYTKVDVHLADTSYKIFNNRMKTM